MKPPLNFVQRQFSQKVEEGYLRIPHQLSIHAVSKPRIQIDAGSNRSIARRASIAPAVEDTDERRLTIVRDGVGQLAATACGHEFAGNK